MGNYLCSLGLSENARLSPKRTDRIASMKYVNLTTCFTLGILNFQKKHPSGFFLGRLQCIYHLTISLSPHAERGAIEIFKLFKMNNDDFSLTEDLPRASSIIICLVLEKYYTY